MAGKKTENLGPKTKTTKSSEAEAPRLNYGSDALAELDVEGVRYRVDALGRERMAVSRRSAETLDWEQIAEVQWATSAFRCRALKGVELEPATRLGIEDQLAEKAKEWAA